MRLCTQKEASAACAGPLERLETGTISAPIALMEMLLAVEDAALVAEAMRARSTASALAVARLIEQNEAGCARVAAMLQSGVDTPPRGGTVEEGVAFCRRLFDWSVRQSEEASVALYSLGSPDLLAAATREVTELFRAWGLLGEGREALDIGCGIGRLEQAFAPHMAHVHGIDVSEAMIDAARRRCAALPNVSFATCSGLDLREFTDARFDLVFAVDSFPYLVQSGPPLVAAYFAETSRVLRPRGDFVVLNYSYRGDGAADRADVSALAAAHDFTVVTDGASPFTLWNAVAFHLVKGR